MKCQRRSKMSKRPLGLARKAAPGQKINYHHHGTKVVPLMSLGVGRIRMVVEELERPPLERPARGKIANGRDIVVIRTHICSFFWSEAAKIRAKTPK